MRDLTGFVARHRVAPEVIAERLSLRLQDKEKTREGREHRTSCVQGRGKEEEGGGCSVVGVCALSTPRRRPNQYNREEGGRRKDEREREREGETKERNPSAEATLPMRAPPSGQLNNATARTSRQH